VAGNEMDDAIMQYLKRKYNLLIGERTAEQIKMTVGSAYPLEKPVTMEIKGRNLIEGVNLDRRIREETGLPVSIAEDPLASVVLGTGKMLTDFKLLRRIAIE
jgi:rod shape-determining protein MreB